MKASLSVVGAEEYIKESKNNIKMRGGLIVNSEAELKSYITEALNGNTKKNLHLGAIPQNVINQIENDINAKIFKDKQYTFVVSYDDIRHISEHFPDVDELTNEIIRLYDILSNYDSVECLIEDKGRKKLRLEKAYSHADYRSIEIVSNKTSSVDLISFYVTKKHNKKGSQSVPPATQGSFSSGARLPNNTVPQNAQSVNNNDMQNEKKDTSSRLERESTLKYSVRRDVEGNMFVDVDPELFDVRDGESHAKTIARIIKERFNNLISVNGQQIQINKTTNDEWRRSNGADALKYRDSQGYFDKLKTIPFADEILEAAKNWIGEELHHPRKDDIVEFARGNIYYRVGNNGYVADVIVAIRKNGSAVLYDLDDIRAKKITDVSLTMASESPQRSAETSVTDNISQLETDVNKKYSRQRLNDTWEGIRDKLYENEVHEDIIGEIETYIKKLTTRKLARETAVTEGLIPKYEAILKIAREYTKGSEVSAYQLADTINDLMWAAHDGNLDTKQFISTVKLIATDILTSGKKVIDDRYRETTYIKI